MADYNMIGIRLIDNNGDPVPLLVPDWPVGSGVEVASSWVDIPTYIATYPTFPFECTWFVNGSTRLGYARGMGFANVWDVAELAANNTVWYVENDTTRFIQFVRASSLITYVRLNANGAYTDLPVYATDSQSARVNVLTTFISYTKGAYSAVPDDYTIWSFQGIRSNGVWHYRTASPQPVNTVQTNSVVDAFWEGVTPIITPSDPFAPGGESDTGGGEGNFDGTSVDVDFTALPTLSAVDTGFITIYNPTLAQLQSLASYMWSNLFDLDTLKKLFADPMQAILGLSILPGPIPSGASQAVKVGNIETTVTMTKAASQYFDVDCGTLNVEEFWGAYLDYEPYTKAEIYLPYIGTHQIAVDDIMGKAVHIKYHVDILSGACSAEIKCGGSVLYTFIGSVAVSVPVTGNDWTNVINGVLSIAGSIGSMVATGGLSAPSAIGSIASSAVNQLKPSIQKSGSVSGGGGLLAGKVPVLILTRPRQALPASQNEFTGYPAFITRTLGDVSGYTEIHKIRLGGIPAVDAELEEIEGLLKGGVIL